MASKKSASYDVSLYSYNEIVKGTEKQNLDTIKARYASISKVADAAGGALAYLGGKIVAGMSAMRAKPEEIQSALGRNQSTCSTYKNYFLSVEECADLYNVPVGQGLILGKEGVRQYLPEVLKNRHFWQDMDDTDLRAYLNLVIEAKGDCDKAWHNIGKAVRGTGKANTSGSGGSGNVKTGTDSQTAGTMNVTIGAPAPAPAESSTAVLPESAPAAPAEKRGYSPAVMVLGAFLRRYEFKIEDSWVNGASVGELMDIMTELETKIALASVPESEFAE